MTLSQYFVLYDNIEADVDTLHILLLSFFFFFLLSPFSLIHISLMAIDVLCVAEYHCNQT